jgi:hypothetical protein
MKRRDEIDELLAPLHAALLKVATRVKKTRSLPAKQLKALDRDIEKSRKFLANTKPGRKKKA